MVREERDPAFWQAVADHPDVRHVKHGHELNMASVVGADDILPLASEHGGYLFTQRDHFGTVWELHSLYLPDGWGREAHDALVQCLTMLFVDRRAAIVFTFETDHPQSKAPKSFGFERAPLPIQSFIGRLFPAHLTAERWFSSPAWRRVCRHS